MIDKDHTINKAEGRLLDTYFSPKAMETWGNGRVYELLGVRVFKGVMMATLGKLAKTLNNGQVDHYFIGSDRSDESLLKFETHTRWHEATHLVGAICSTPFVDIPVVSDLQYLFIGSLAFNAYLVMLQRYNRARIYNAINNDETSSHPLR